MYDDIDPKMYDDIDPKLLPSRDLLEQLRLIGEATPNFRDLCKQRPEETGPTDLQEYIYATRDGKKLVYPMVEIPGPWTGQMFVGRMPGRTKEFSGAYELKAIKNYGIDRLYCLLPFYDIITRQKFLDYFSLAQDLFGDRFHHVEIMDYEPPTHHEIFNDAVLTLTRALKAGEKVLAHCGAGCGRTGVLVACAMVELGISPSEAIRTYRQKRGCGPETGDQAAYILRYAQERT
jgi:hypothetical protein